MSLFFKIDVGFSGQVSSSQVRGAKSRSQVKRAGRLHLLEIITMLGPVVKNSVLLSFKGDPRPWVTLGTNVVKIAAPGLLATLAAAAGTVATTAVAVVTSPAVLGAAAVVGAGVLIAAALEDDEKPKK